MVKRCEMPDRVGTAGYALCRNRDASAAFAHPAMILLDRDTLQPD